MENASKALIIAGAILIAILLIGIGVGLINALSNPMDIATGQLDEQAKKMINSKFENYAGKQSGTNIMSLISDIRSYNSSNANGNVIVFKGSGWKEANGSTSIADTTISTSTQAPLANLSAASSKVVRNHTYRVEFIYGTDSTKSDYGIIKEITVYYN